MQTIDNPRIEKFVNFDPDGFVTLQLVLFLVFDMYNPLLNGGNILFCTLCCSIMFIDKKTTLCNF